MKIANSILNKTFQHGILIHKEKIARHTYHIKLQLARPFSHYLAGQQLRIFVGLENVLAFSDLKRTYSVWHYDPAKLEVDLAISTFSNGQGAGWATALGIGDLVYFSGPKGKFTVDSSAETYFFIGDISALGPLYEIARHLESPKTIHGLIYLADQADFFKDTFSGLAFHSIVSNGNAAEQVIEMLDSMDFAPHQTMAYLAGETHFCKALHTYFRKTRNLDSKRIKTKPFWHPDKKGLE